MLWLELILLSTALCLAGPAQYPLGSDALFPQEYQQVRADREQWHQPGLLEPCLQGPACKYRTNLRVTPSSWVFAGLVADASAGTPAQDMEVFLTMGSAPFFLVNCSATDGHRVSPESPWRMDPSHHCYNAPRSQTSSVSDAPVWAEWEGTTVHGKLASDFISIAGAEANSTFLLGLDYDIDPWTFPLYDSIMSLSRFRLPEKEPEEIQSPLRRIFEQEVLDHNMVSFEFVSPVDNDDWLFAGTMTLGNFDKRYLQTYIFELRPYPEEDLDPDWKFLSDWQVRGIEARSGGDSLNISNSTVIFSAFWPYLTLPAELADAIYSRINYTGELDRVVDCSMRSQLPEITLELGEYANPPSWGDGGSWNLTVNGYDYTQELWAIDGQGQRVKQCSIQILSSDFFDGMPNRDVVILGFGFMRGFHTSFYYDEDTVLLSKRLD